MTESPPTASRAKLEGGPLDTQIVPIRPGQAVIVHTDSIAVDQGPPTPWTSRYVYKRMLDNQPDVALFVLDV
jgi:hypothetical protein